MHENEKALGALPSPFDYRDEIAAASVVAQLATISLPPVYQSDLGEDLNQRGIPACASHDVALKLRLSWYKKYGEWVDFSPRFLDTLAKRFDGQDRATGGTFIKLLMQLVVKYGCATTATLPNDTTLPVLQYRNDALLTPAVMAEAAKYKMPGYFAVPTDRQSTRAAIYLYGAVCMGATISTGWYGNKGEKLPVPITQADIAGGHATTPKGWQDAKLNTLRNQWGKEWGANDEAPYDSDEFRPFTFEQWAFTEIPADVASFLKVLPSPSNFHYTWNTNLTQGMKVIGAIDFSGANGAKPYATDPAYASSIAATYTAVLMACPEGVTPAAMDAYIAKAMKAAKITKPCPVTGAMIDAAAEANGILPGILCAVLHHESCFGMLGAGARTHNPGNVGNVDSGATKDWLTWEAGTNACAYQLKRRQLPGGTDDVRFLQVALMILGFLAPLSPNEFGIYGTKTAAAVGAFQKANGISPVPASCGPLTRAKLNARFAV